MSKKPTYFYDCITRELLYKFPTIKEASKRLGIPAVTIKKSMEKGANNILMRRHMYVSASSRDHNKVLHRSGAPATIALDGGNSRITAYSFRELEHLLGICRTKLQGAQYYQKSPYKYYFRPYVQTKRIRYPLEKSELNGIEFYIWREEDENAGKNL